MIGRDISETKKRLGRLAGIAIILAASGAGVGASAETAVQPIADTQTTIELANDPEALRRQGEIIVYSVDPEIRDVPGGIALLEQSAAKGNTAAKLTLGEIYLYGLVVPPDLPRSLEYFEEIAAAGDGSGLAQYGMMLMWSEADWATAENYLIRATDLGTSSAWATLAEGAMYGYLGGGAHSRHKFDGFAEKARAANNARIEVLDAIRQMWGISMRASGPATIAKLQAAADVGNAEAAKFLISLQRDGNGMNIRRDRDGAIETLTRYSNLLSSTEIWQFNLSVQAARARDVADYEAVAAEVTAHPEWITKPLGVELQRANENAAIYVLQTRLQARGLYSGPLNGLATRSTIHAMYHGCDRILNRASCDDSVMRPDVIAALLTAK